MADYSLDVWADDGGAVAVNEPPDDSPRPSLRALPGSQGRLRSPAAKASDARERNERQAALAARAKAGDRAAAETLIREELWHITYRAAKQYGAKFGVDPDDLAQVAFARLPKIVASFRPETGWTFLNYYVNCSTRAMTAEARRAVADRLRQFAAAGRYSDVETIYAVPARSGSMSRAAQIAGEALETLPPILAMVLGQSEGYYGPERSLDRIAAEIGVTPERCFEIYEEAFTRVRRAVEQAA